MNLERLRSTLIDHEGLRLKVYDDMTGRPLTRGQTLKGNATIGIGRNLVGRGLTRDEAYSLLDNDIQSVSHALFNQFPWFDSLDSPRQEALANLCFNMGIGTLATFRQMLSAVAHGKWEHAADALLDSRYATQVGLRALYLADLLRRGRFD